MVLTIKNQISSPRSYVVGNVTVAGNSNVSVPSGLIPFLAVDPQFLSDLSTTTIIVNDGQQDYSGDTAVNFVRDNFIQGKSPQMATDPVIFSNAGFGFSICQESTISNTTETDFLLFRNPGTSNFNARAMFLYGEVSSTQGEILTRVYTAPSISNVGTDITSSAVNNLVGSTNATSMKVYSNPTITARGNERIPILLSANTTPILNEFKQTAILQPGYDMLITVQGINVPTPGSISFGLFLDWVEAIYEP